MSLIGTGDRETSSSCGRPEIGMPTALAILVRLVAGRFWVHAVPVLAARSSEHRRSPLQSTAVQHAYALMDWKCCPSPSFLLCVAIEVQLVSAYRHGRSPDMLVCYREKNSLLHTESFGPK